MSRRSAVRRPGREPYDVVIVGGGPAGTSAALVLGRCRRSVLVIDSGEYRNAAARRIHGLLGHDGAPPPELRRRAAREVRAYGGVIVRDEAVDAWPVPGGFEVTLAAGSPARGRFLVLATGLRDRWPPIEGLGPLVGSSAFHCPVCDGWEVRDQPLAAVGHGPSGVEEALGLTTWSRDVVLLTHGHALGGPERRRLEAASVGVREDRIARVGPGRPLVEVVLATGEVLRRRALFFHPRLDQRSRLADRLGCALKRGGTVRVDRFGQSTVPGVYVAGDAAGDVLLVAVAIAEGAKCAFAINKGLREAVLP